MAPENTLSASPSDCLHCREACLNSRKSKLAQPADKPGAAVAYDTQMFKLLPPGWTDQFQKGIQKGAFGYININHNLTWLFTTITEPMIFLFSTPPLPDFSPHSFLLLHDDSVVTIHKKKEIRGSLLEIYWNSTIPKGRGLEYKAQSSSSKGTSFLSEFY